MDKARLLEILTRERHKLREGGVEWLRTYGASAQSDLDFTFYMICRALSQSEQDRVLSGQILNKIKKDLQKQGVQFEKKWNPVDWFSKEWTEAKNPKGSFSRKQKITSTTGIPKF